MKSENWKSFYGPCYLKRLDLPTQTFTLTASFSGWFNEKNPDYEFVVFFCCEFKNIIRCSSVNGCQVLPAVHKRSTLHQFSTFCYIKKVTGVSEEFTGQSNYCSRSHIVRCFQSLVFLLIFFKLPLVVIIINYFCFFSSHYKFCQKLLWLSHLSAAFWVFCRSNYQFSPEVILSFLFSVWGELPDLSRILIIKSAVIPPGENISFMSIHDRLWQEQLDKLKSRLL